MIAVERLIGSRRDIVATHKLLGKILGALKLGTGFGGADDRYSAQRLVVAEEVVDALDQRIFGADNNHINALCQNEVLNALEIIGFKSHVDSSASLCAGISRSYKKSLDARRLQDFPCQSMLTSTAAQ